MRHILQPPPQRVIAYIPHLPALSAVVCRARLPAAKLMPALAAHSSLTRLGLAGTAGDEAELVVGVLSSALPSWPRLASLRMEQRMYLSAPAIAVVSNLLAPALAVATALTSLDASGMLVTPELARALGALTQLAKLHLKGSFRVQEAMPDYASLSRLRTLCGPSAIGVDQPACVAALHGITACRSLLHLDLSDDLCPGCGLGARDAATTRKYSRELAP